ncbi:unnamed protein product, partial [Closterium sp. NIES-54]
CTLCLLRLLQFLRLVRLLRRVRCLLLRLGLVLSLRPARVASCPTRLSSGTTALVTPPCLVFEAWPPVSLSLVSPGLSLPFRRGLPPLASLASRGGSALPLTPPSFLRQRLHCRLFTWMCGAQPCYVMLSFAFTSVCLPSYVRALHAWC